ncbi:MAG: hypothetical protein LBT35_00765, partial [Tannerella sp.]|nr:hypothetical protein [Tannerella sp.]
METLVIYLLKSSIWIAVFWLIYRFFLRNELFFRFNRLFLLAGLTASFALALCRFTYYIDIEYQPAAFVFTDLPVTQMEAVVPPPPPFDWTTFLLAGLYMSGAVFLLSYHLLGLYKIRKMINRNPDNRDNIIDVKGIKSSFSLFGHVFMDMQSGMSEMEKKLILEHEKAHIEQHHWMDVVLAQVVCTLLWFNPFAWLCLSAIKQNHEYLADRSVLGKGHSRAVYNAALINNTFKIPVFTLTNSFSYYKLKRIDMMKKNDSRPAKKLAVLLIAPALLAYSWAFAEPEYRYSVSVQDEAATTAVNDAIAADDQPERTASQDTVKVVYTKGNLTSMYTSVDSTMTVELDSIMIKLHKHIMKINLDSMMVNLDSMKVQLDTMKFKFATAHRDAVISGKVLDPDGKVIPGAIIILDGENTDVASDADGNFTIKSDKGKVAIDYETANKETLDVKEFMINCNAPTDHPLILVDGKETT